MADPSKAQMLAEAYRRGLLPPDRAAAYEEAARRGIVNDPYAVQHAAPSNPVVGYVNRAMGEIPFLPEINAGARAAVATGVQALSGQKADFGANFNAMRAGDQGAQDRFDQDHPILSANARALGTVVPAAVLGGASLARTGAAEVAASAPKVVARGVVPTVRRATATVTRNAVTGGAVAGVYGAAQPGTLDQRTRTAAAAIPGGAAMGAAVPAALEGVVAGGRAVGNALGQVAPRVVAVGSEMVDPLRQALAGRPPGNKKRPLIEAQSPKGRQNTGANVRQTGVAPDQPERLDAQVGGRPGPTAGASGSTASSQASRRANWLITTIENNTGIGRSQVFGNVEEMMNAARRAHKGILDQFYGTRTPSSPDIIKIMNSRNIRPTRLNASSIVEQANFDPDVLPIANSDNIVPMGILPSARTIDLTLQMLDKEIFKNWDHEISSVNAEPSVASKLRDLEYMRSILAGDDSAFGDAYRDVADAIGDRAAIAAAFNASRGRIFDKAEDAPSFAEWFDNLRPFEQRAARTSAASDIYRMMSAINPETDLLRSNQTQQKLTKLFGSSAAADLTNQIVKDGADVIRLRPNDGFTGPPAPSDSVGSLTLDMGSRNALDKAQSEGSGNTSTMLVNAFDPPPNATWGPSLLEPLAGGIAAQAFAAQQPNQQ